MKSNLLFPFVLFAGLVLVGFSDSPVYSQSPQEKPAKVFVVRYTCPMHAEILQDEPGNCPKCGMKLVEKKVDAKAKKAVTKDSVKMKHDHMNHEPMKMKSDSAKMKM